MNGNPTLSRHQVRVRPGTRSRLLAWLMFMASGVCASAALALALFAGRILIAGFGGERAGELFLGGFVLPLLALFCAGLALLALRSGQERIRQRHRIYYPGR